ncbi:MAG: glycosyltransferase [bacterium]
MGWLKENRRRVDVLHFHWLHHIYNRRTYRDSLLQVLRFAAQLAYARRLGYRVVWTVHNLYPHERPWPHLDRWVRRLMVRYSQAILVHCDAAREMVQHEFRPRSRIHVAPLGSYIGAYRRRVARTAARRWLGVPEGSIVLLHQGGLRPYKGLEQLVRTLDDIPDPRLVLVIAGKAHGVYKLAATLAERLVRDRRLILREGWIPDDELPGYFAAADAVVCPFEAVLTSSSVMLALSLGRPVVAPALGCLPELVPPDAGILYDPNDPAGLRDALLRCAAADLAVMGERAYRVAQTHTWAAAARVVLKAYTGQG